MSRPFSIQMQGRFPGALSGVTMDIDEMKMSRTRKYCFSEYGALKFVGLCSAAESEIY